MKIGELDHELQAKLLRDWSHQQFIKIGGYKPTQCECAHTGCHQPVNLQKESEEGHSVRSFLPFIRIPDHPASVGERKQGPSAIGRIFMQYFASKVKKQVTGLSAGFIEKLEAYTWPEYQGAKKCDRSAR